jgi:hypothetical protein
MGSHACSGDVIAGSFPEGYGLSKSYPLYSACDFRQQ